MTKRDDQILPPSTLRAVDEWERESEIGRTEPAPWQASDAERAWARVEAAQEAYYNAKPARPDLYPSHVGVSTMPSPADRKLTARQFKGALVAAFAAGWGAVELVRWVVE